MRADAAADTGGMPAQLRVLLIDDDEDSFVLTRDLLDDARPGYYMLKWASSYESGLDQLLSGLYDVCLLDHNLGARSGVDLLREVSAQGSTVPVLMLTGQADGQSDTDAMVGGAADYLIKGEITAALLERAIRYTVARSNAESARRESERRFRSLVDSTPDALIVHAEGRLIFANAAAYRFFGADSAVDLLGRQLLEFVHPEDHAAARTRIASLLEDGAATPPAERRFLRVDGTVVHGEVAAGLVTYDGYAAVQVMIRDLTERKRVEAFRAGQTRALELLVLGRPLEEVLSEIALAAESEHRMRMIFMLADETGRELTIGATPTLPARFRAAIRGISIVEGAGSGGTAAFRREPVVVEDIAVDPLWQDFRVPAAEAGVRACWSFPILASTGQVLGTVCTCYDEARGPTPGETALIRNVAQIAGVAIERRRSEEALRRSERRFRALMNNSLDIVTVLDRDGTIVYESPSVARVLGFPPEDLIGLQVADFIHPDDRPQMAAAFMESTNAPGSRFALEFRCRNRDGHWRVLEALGQNLLTDPVVQGVVINSRDVTGRRRTEAELRSSQERFSKAFRAAPLGLSLTSLTDGRIIEVNQRMADLLGYSAETVIGRTSLELDIWVDPAQRETAVRILQKDGRLERFPALLRARDGSARDIEMYVEPIDVDGEACLLAVHHDVSEQRALEEHLRQSQRIEAVGRLAGGIAHDFNNLLTGILGYAELVLSELPAESAIRADVQEIISGGRRARDLTGQLLAFSRKQVLRPEVIDVAASVAGMQKLLHRVIGEDIEIVIDADGSGRVEADPSQIEQVIMNLAVNARDAMPDGGSIVLRTRLVEVTPAMVKTFAYEVEPGPYVRLDVADTGSGMSQEVQERVFEPFFTTKERGKGTGLGLSTVYGIVKQSDGFIEVQSAPGQGTTIGVHLPHVDKQVSPEPVDGPVVPSTGGSETILIVEDEDNVRKLVRRILEKQGYRVLETSSPTHALLELVPEHAQEIDLLLTDVVMPEMSGRELVEKVHQIRSDLRVVYMSGYTEDEVARRGIVDAGRSFLAKPFTPAQLAETVRAILDR